MAPKKDETETPDRLTAAMSQLVLDNGYEPPLDEEHEMLRRLCCAARDGRMDIDAMRALGVTEDDIRKAIRYIIGTAKGENPAPPRIRSPIAAVLLNRRAPSRRLTQPGRSVM